MRLRDLNRKYGQAWAQRLRVGERVRWIGSGVPGEGEVIEAGYNAVKVRWDDTGEIGIVMRSEITGNLAPADGGAR